MIDVAETIETACSTERPPKSNPTRSFPIFPPDTCDTLPAFPVRPAGPGG